MIYAWTALELYDRVTMNILDRMILIKTRVEFLEFNNKILSKGCDKNNILNIKNDKMEIWS